MNNPILTAQQIAQLRENTGQTDPFQSAEYQRFVESMVPHCRCDSQYRPCDSVLAGGICEEMHDREIDPFDNEEELS